MSEAFKHGNYTTDTTTGKRFIAIDVVYAAIAGNTGVAARLAGVDYVVTVGKVFHVTAIYVMQAAVIAAASNPILRYADNAALTTNPVSMDFGVPKVASPVALNEIPIYMSTVLVPAGKYVGLYNNSATPTSDPVGISILGFEV